MIQFRSVFAEFYSGMALTKRKVRGSYPVPPWMLFFREVSVVIVARDQSEVLGACLQTLYKSQAPWKEVIVVNNASSDDTVSMIEDRFPKVSLTTLEQPLGMEAFNRGFEAAQGDWILSLDYNCAPDVDSWKGLCRILKCDPDSDVVSFSVIKHLRENLRQMNRASLVEAGSFVHGGVLFRKRCFEAIGGFDDTLPDCGSELHWAARMFLDGRDILHCPEACIIRSDDGAGEDVSAKAEQTTANYLLLALRHAPENQWQKLLRRRVRDVLVYSILHGSWAYLRALRKAFHDWKKYPDKIQRLPEKEFKRLTVDWRVPFGFLG